MSNNINEVLWEDTWEEIARLESILDDVHMARVADVALVNGLHEDDDRDEILNIIAEEMMEEKNL
tara:strand:+ start:2073 stop:2267 length:195 start_codon:yes stop_codon:yes gene_type:complete